ncbi:MAG TPA: hypothetical protein DCO79_08515 [Spirochaeta sp.]|nr:hypothetical protein [Spirochaeta sp.]
MSVDHEEWKKSKVQLEAEIAEFEREKEEIKALIGNIGGKSYSKRDNVINIVFLAIIIILFVLEITTHWLPAFISLEISVLLVSIKIVWMIHSQHKYNHFIFWILNTIEFRVNDVGKKVKKIERLMNEVERR